MARASNDGRFLMESHIQAKGLNVWRVTSEGMKSKGQQEKQFDAIAKCVILSSLDNKIFNRVFACENAKDLGKLSRKTMRVQKMLQMKNIIFSLINLIASSNLMMGMPNQYTHG